MEGQIFPDFPKFSIEYYLFYSVTDFLLQSLYQSNKSLKVKTTEDTIEEAHELKPVCCTFTVCFFWGPLVSVREMTY